MADSKTHRWQFAARFRRNAFGWRSQPAIERVHEAVAEIRKAARRDPALARAVLFIETEGFDTADLKDAKALLEKLGG
jgi:hypothetical protein